MSDFLPGLEGVPATKSAISFIDGEKGILSYRGYPLETLATNSTFEETTLLLLDGELPTKAALNRFSKQLRSSYRIKYHIREMMRPQYDGQYHCADGASGGDVGTHASGLRSNQSSR